eukprot:Gregarina_sp_Poly_1__2353@NODE_162_length_12261_cov_105_116123_g144_i0_p1_GENE_NODE_162_length_12261_cov_105_116123_g144_i0NODE_162_length_12261_cov_105_116123_g144_i0_p1_ORF_typecomplete_len1144_score188_10DUF726/PF05277_12/3_1e03DUF726/PF05277_12/5_6e72DUF900/PF05990_12/5_7e07Thioesterase/PF00975_20/1e04Thioesterase/PF00975_20/0_02LCAT/PF02450_15/0_082PEPPE/PF08237_11/0_21Hydrolase_4/PF12146_8/0_23SepZ/PF06066_11/2_6_NODE_162_length_12261_cov_105_116123_g144_i0751710948
MSRLEIHEEALPLAPRRRGPSPSRDDGRAATSANTSPGSAQQSQRVEEKNAVEAADFGKLHQKTKRKQFELRQVVQKNRLESIRSRRKGLATLSLFTFVSIHKMEKGILESTANTVREALFLIVFHHLIMKCEEVLRCVALHGNGDRSAGQLTLPALGDPLLVKRVSSKQQDAAAETPTMDQAASMPSGAAGEAMATSSLGSIAQQDSDGDTVAEKNNAKHTRKPETRKLDPKLVFSWAKGAAKAYATALRVNESPAAMQLIRHLDRYVTHMMDSSTVGDNELISGTLRFSSKQRMQTMTRIQPHCINPLVFNPQPAKRHLLTFSHLVQDRILRRMVASLNRGADPQSLTNPFVDDIESDNVQPLNLNFSSSSETVPQKFSSLFLSRLHTRSGDETPSEQPGTSPGSPTVGSFLSPMSPDELENLTNSKLLTKQLDDCSTVHELAERLSLLPEVLTTTIINCIEEEKSAAQGGRLLVGEGTPPVSNSAPVLDVVGVSEPSANAEAASSSHLVSEELAGDLFDATASPFEDELVPWMPEDSSANGASSARGAPSSSVASSDQQQTPDKLSILKAEAQTVVVSARQEALLPPPLSPQLIQDLDSVDATHSVRPHSVATIDTREGRGVPQFFEYIPFHLMVFWESLHLLLKAGCWDSLLGDIFRTCAVSLDIDQYLFELLVSYTADLVAELNMVQEGNAGFARGSSMRSATNRSTAATGRSSKYLQPPADRTLATTSTHQLRMSKAISRGKVLKIAGMALGVGALSALTAGIAAPAFAAGFGALGIAGTSGFAAFLGSAGGSATLASLFGASSASLSGWKISRRLADIKVFEFVHLHSNYVIDGVAGYISEVMELYTETTLKRNPRPRSSLGIAHLHPSQVLPPRKSQPPFNIVIGISGWLNTIDDATKPWMCMADKLGTELFALKWEPQLLTELGFMMIRMVGENVASSAASLALQMTMTATGSFIMWPVSLLQYAGQLDNTWITCRHRAQQAGVLLAAALSDRALVGHRPVTLLGYSMGSRVITCCLKELYRRGEFNRVQDVIVMGLPGSKQRDAWKKMRSVVSGRLVNVYCSTDWILAFLYRWMEWGVQVAGLSAVEDVAGVENVDATGIVISHNHYERRIPEILSYIKLHSSFAHLIEAFSA